MKVCSALFALFALQNANAFTPKQTPAFSTKLNVESSVGYSPQYSSASYAPPRDVTSAPYSPPRNVPSPYSSGSAARTEDIWQTMTPVVVQGGSLRTCSFDESIERVNIVMKTTGRPLNANVELWQGPDNTPQKMAVYLEDGNIRPFRAIVETPGSTNSIAIRNTAQIEYPLAVGIEADSAPMEVVGESRIVQGGAVYTTPFSPAVSSVIVSITTDGRPLNARIELLQGPNNNKQVMEVYTEDGSIRPFQVVLDTPGAGNVIRIVNTATVEYPIRCVVEPYTVDAEGSYGSTGMQWS